MGTTPVPVAASLILQDLTYTADATGTGGNSITIQYTDTATAGMETVNVTVNAIVVGIESGVSTATQVKAAVDGSVAASALVSVAISGTASDPQVTVAATNLTGGITSNFSTARYTSETLSGTPETTESQQIRSDRMSSGQIVTGLTVEGDINFELAKESQLESLMESAMLNTWDVLAPVSVNMTINATTKEITRASGDWSAALEIGDILTLAGFSNTENNTQFQILEFVSTTVVRGVFNQTDGDVVSETGTGTTYTRADKLVIGTTKKSFSIQKEFTDLTTKALIYKGMLVNTMSINVAYGDIITGAFGFNGTKYLEADAASEFITYNRTVNSPATTNSFNGSIDMPFINSDAVGTLDEVSFCIQSVSLALNNNYLAQTCIGEAAPKDYSPGTAQIEINMSTYLSNANWGLLSKKLTQEPFALGFLLKNIGGAYGFYFPAIQVSFPDPASGGANQEISLDMSGLAKVGDAGESALVIYRV